MYILKAIVDDKSYWFPLGNKEKTYILGSREDCDFCLPFRGVSRKHCKLFFKGGVWWVEDLNSTNGTYLNGTKIKSEKLNEDDVLTCGIVNLTFLKKPTSEWITASGEDSRIFGGYRETENKEKLRTTDSINKVDENKDILYKCCRTLFSREDLTEKFKKIMEFMGIENLRVIYRQGDEDIMVFSETQKKGAELKEVESFIPDIKISFYPDLDEKKREILCACATLLSIIKIGYKAPSFAPSRESMPPSPLGVSKIAKHIWENALIYKDSKVPILVTGETGVGKEIFSRALHSVSSRANMPFIPINIVEFPEGLREAEIFGIEEKVATGVKKNIGKFEQANGGAILLDEIGDIPKGMQLMLLRILENEFLYRVGGTVPVPLDVRFFFATNKNIEKEVEKGNIRPDFYFRIKGVHFNIPPLRERKEDISFFLEKLLDELNKRYERKINYSAAAWDALHSYSWPGNVREMKWVLEKVYAKALSVGIIQSDMLELEGKEKTEDKPISISFQEEIEKLEKELILKALKASKNISEAIKLLKVSRATFYSKLKKYKINI